MNWFDAALTNSVIQHHLRGGQYNRHPYLREGVYYETEKDNLKHARRRAPTWDIASFASGGGGKCAVCGI